MSKVKTVVPKVPSAKVLARYQDHLKGLTSHSVQNHSVGVTRHAMNLCQIHDDNEDKHANVTPESLKALSPHARAAYERILGTPKDPDYMSSIFGEK